ncbi:hypothetical protein [Limnohabitans sp. Jir72]|uniref:hypothetical protein n=1 Tax=Limnohabitans sp. Jir72 TaxID=1977909 RepID=UPI000D3D0D59|nr:hypothetical protein [Limnohabitans sp. Jir72]PUE23719.1 hypothetical protein B9Z52_17315 [Limnohabitans sp. Jir72]
MTVKTQRARRVLNDARFALEKFKENPIDVDFRHLVVLCCVLIRTVGDALKKENEEDKINLKKQNDYYKKVISSDNLYTNFIKSSRDSIIHEYIARIEWESNTDLEKNHSMEYLMKEGIFKGNDFRELVGQSIEFWEKHLTLIENI